MADAAEANNDMPRVMLVDDDYDAVYSFKVVLESNGCDVDGFTDPYLALRNFSEELYDLIVVDIKMPKFLWVLYTLNDIHSGTTACEIIFKQI